MKYIVFILLSLSMGCFSTPYRDAFTIINTENESRIVVKTQDYYYEEIPCITKDSIYSIYRHYEQKKTFLTEWDMKGQFISKYEFPFDYKLFLMKCSCVDYNPLTKEFLFRQKENIFVFNLNTHQEKKVYEMKAIKYVRALTAPDLTFLDKNHIIFVKADEATNAVTGRFRRTHCLMIVNINTALPTLVIDFDHENGCGILAVSHNKEMVVLYLGPSRSVIYSLKEKKVIANLGETWLESCVAWSKDDAQLFYLSRYEVSKIDIKCLDIASGKVSLLSENLPSETKNLCLYDDNTLLYSNYHGNVDCKMNMFDIQKKRIIKSWIFDRISTIWANPPYIIIGNN